MTRGDEFDGLHDLSMNSQGRRFAGDRGNNRIQIFNPVTIQSWYA